MILNENWQFLRDEEFRQTVIRQAMLLGFQAEEYWLTGRNAHQKWWNFHHEGKLYDGYSSCYSAALEYLRLLGIPSSAIGVVHAEDNH